MTVSTLHISVCHFFQLESWLKESNHVTECYQMFCKKMFHFMCDHLQHVFDMLKHLQKCFSVFILHVTCVKHLQYIYKNVSEVVTCKIKH